MQGLRTQLLVLTLQECCDIIWNKLSLRHISEEYYLFVCNIALITDIGNGEGFENRRFMHSTLRHYNIIIKRIAQKCSTNYLWNNDCNVSYLDHIEAINLIQSRINRRTVVG